MSPGGKLTSLLSNCSQPSPSLYSPSSVGTQLSTKYGCLHPMTWMCVTLAYYSSYRTNIGELWNILHQVLFNWIATTAIYDILFFCKISIFFVIKLIILYHIIVWLTPICHAGVLVYCTTTLCLAQCDRFLISCVILSWLHVTRDENFGSLKCHWLQILVFKSNSFTFQ